MASYLSAYLGPPETAPFKCPSGDEIRAAAQDPSTLFYLIIETITAEPPYRYSEARHAVRTILYHPACYVQTFDNPPRLDDDKRPMSTSDRLDPRFDAYIATIRDRELIQMVLKYRIHHYQTVADDLMNLSPLRIEKKDATVVTAGVDMIHDPVT